MIFNFFITIKIIDIIDIFLVALLLYQLYIILKDSIAVHIFAGFFGIYLIWLMVKALNMQMLSLILGQFMGVGIIALLVVFQPELRKIFLMIGSKYFSQFKLTSIEEIFKHNKTETIDKTDEVLEEIIKAVTVLSHKKTGAIIVYSKKLSLKSYAQTGIMINANVNHEIIISIFFKDNPLHDGAIIIHKNKIVAAKVVLPIYKDINIDEKFGMRHRAALSMNYETDVPVIIVSEETGAISIAHNKKIIEIDYPFKLKEFLKS